MVLDTDNARTQLVQTPSVTSVVAEGREDSTQRGALSEAQSHTATLGHLRLDTVETSDLEIDLVPADRPGVRSLLGLDVLGTQRLGFYSQFSVGLARGTHEVVRNGLRYDLAIDTSALSASVAVSVVLGTRR